MGAGGNSPPNVTKEVVVLISEPDERSRVRVALEAGGYVAVLPHQILPWATARRPHVLLVTDDTPRAGAVRAAITEAVPEAACVVLTNEPTPTRYRLLLSSCTAVLPAAAADADLLAAVAAAWRALACLPATAARALTGNDATRPAVTPREAAWLRDLADGATVGGLARSAGYSQREMYRLLANLYTRLGASTRTEALLRADRCGLLDPPAATAATAAPVAAVADAPADPLAERVRPRMQA